MLYIKIYIVTKNLWGIIRDRRRDRGRVLAAHRGGWFTHSHPNYRARQIYSGCRQARSIAFGPPTYLNNRPRQIYSGRGSGRSILSSPHPLTNRISASLICVLSLLNLSSFNFSPTPFFNLFYLESKAYSYSAKTFDATLGGLSATAFHAKKSNYSERKINF